MRRFIRVVVFTTALIVMTASSAGAVTWANDGATAFHSTASGGTLSVTGSSSGCAGATVTGTATAGAVGVTWAAVHGTAIMTGCTLAGVPSPTDCAYRQTAFSQVSAGPPAVFGGAVHMSCSIYMSNEKVCEIVGSVDGTYTNPTGTTGGRVTGFAPGTLRTGACSAGIAGSNEPATMTHRAFTSSSPAFSPFITRTP
jgi:hypothetical protein